MHYREARPRLITLEHNCLSEDVQRVFFSCVFYLREIPWQFYLPRERGVGLVVRRRCPRPNHPYRLNWHHTAFEWDPLRELGWEARRFSTIDCTCSGVRMKIAGTPTNDIRTLIEEVGC